MILKPDIQNHSYHFHPHNRNTSTNTHYLIGLSKPTKKTMVLFVFILGTYAWQNGRYRHVYIRQHQSQRYRRVMK